MNSMVVNMMEESSGSKLTRAVLIVVMVADIAETETAEDVEVEIGMATETVVAVVMMIATEAMEAGAETAAIPGKEDLPEMTEAALVPETGRRTGAGVRQGAATVPGVEATGPEAGAREQASGIYDITRIESVISCGMLIIYALIHIFNLFKICQRNKRLPHKKTSIISESRDMLC